MIAFENNDWIVESYGMRSKLLPGTFDIPAERLTEMQTSRQASYYSRPT